ncbi:uncharacterized protein TrAFT101_010492 [Trichoderma asperellum]|uniref:uncharacterized protein n=1 Tax=Trichoderma asperellum TaxID=101201 RepID=UPI00332594BD|nr:hypothetical protein TrAFT101_010492 [Trichoderma asperellum]
MKSLPANLIVRYAGTERRNTTVINTTLLLGAVLHSLLHARLVRSAGNGLVRLQPVIEITGTRPDVSPKAIPITRRGHNKRRSGDSTNTAYPLPYDVPKLRTHGASTQVLWGTAATKQSYRRLGCLLHFASDLRQQVLSCDYDTPPTLDSTTHALLYNRILLLHLFTASLAFQTSASHKLLRTEVSIFAIAASSIRMPGGKLCIRTSFAPLSVN